MRRDVAPQNMLLTTGSVLFGVTASPARAPNPQPRPRARVRVRSCAWGSPPTGTSHTVRTVSSRQAQPAHHHGTNMPLSASPLLLSALGGYFVRSSGADDSRPPTCFFAHVGEQQPHLTTSPTHEALQLPLVLLEVFKHLDSGTLCGSASLVCEAWRAVAESQQLWRARCDAELVQAVAGATRQQAATAALRLPLLHHAVYDCNLLRNPAFGEAANTRDSPCAGGGRQPTCSVALLTSAQRRFAWVPTVGSPRWEQHARPAGHTATLPEPPLPYPTAAPSSSALVRGSKGLQQQLQKWLFGGRPAVAGHQPASPPSRLAAAAPTAANTRSASVASDTSSGAAAARASQDAPAATAATQLPLTCLATRDRHWTEVVQVVDLMAELTGRGLDADTAAAVLDSGALALGLSVWVAAGGDGAAARPATPAATGAGGQPSPPTAGGAGGGAGAAFAVALMLDDGQMHLRSFQTFVRRESSHHFFSRRLALCSSDGWRRFAYLLPSCPKGCRRAVVLLRGRPGATGCLATGAAASPVAVRFASAQLSWVKRADVAAFGADTCLASWADRVVTGL